MESQRLLASKTISNSENESSDEDEWSDGSSYSSYYSDSDSTIPDWEPYVDDFTGELLYIECHPFVTQNKESKLKKHVEPFSKNQMRRSTRGKFLRLIRRKESKRRSKKGQKPTVISDTNTSKVKFQDFQEGEEKEVMLDIDAENRHNLSSDKYLAESLLGLIVSTLSDGNRVMIAGFSYDSKAKNERNIKIGDWLKSINNIEVNVHNLDDILQKFINREDVLLKLQRVAGVEVTKDPPINELNNESNFVRELLNSKSDDEQLLMQTLCKHPVGIVYINTEKLSECNQENEDVTYCFPRPLDKNLLCNSRGIYITLNHLVNDVTKTKPNTTTMKYKDQLAHIVYTSFDNNLLLFMLPDKRASIQEIVLINKEIIRLLQFCYKTVDKCFTTEQYLVQVDHFFSRFFARVLSSGLWATAQQFVELQDLDIKSLQVSPCQFEELLSVAPVLSLPDEAQMQIDDALTELEASDYREWNEEPLDCQRLFTVLGSALYHSGYLLLNHLIYEDLMDVHCFCKQQGLFHLSRTEPVKSLVLWREVFPYSCNRMQNVNVKVPEGKRYLLIVGSAKRLARNETLFGMSSICAHAACKIVIIKCSDSPFIQNLTDMDLLAVIMEAGGCTEPSEDNTGPDAFYVEEAQATLAHLQELGLSELSERFLAMNPGPQIITPVPPNSKRKGDFINLNFSKTNSTHIKESAGSPKKNEVTSILKRRSSDQNFVMQYNSTSSLHDDSFDRQSEGSGSQGGYSERSEISDESKRNVKRAMKYDSNEEDSETDEFGEGSQMSVNSFDVSEIRQTLLSEREDNRPMQLTAGSENVLYHFIQLDMAEGVLLCPPESKLQSQTYEVILNNFKRSCQKIHSLFQHTLRFKNMPAQDMAKSVMNKSLIAIKEHGILFQCPYLDEENKKSKIVYWVVGRLFYMPHPREVYVCYHDGIPQNIIEIAFKMNIGALS